MITTEGTNILLSFSLGMTLSCLLLASLYLLLSKKVVLSDNPAPYQAVRHDVGWLLAVFASSQILALITFLVGGFGSKAMILGSIYDILLSLPFVLKFLIRLLQNQTFCWRWILVAEIPLVVTAIGYVVTFDVAWYYACEIVNAIILLAFTIWYFFSVRRYSKWLHDNFADLKYKETWWGFIVIGIVLLLYLSYYFAESVAGIYVLRLMILVTVVFLTWRADNVQNLSSLMQVQVLPAECEDAAESDYSQDAEDDEPSQTDALIPATYDYTGRLAQLARDTQFYLQYDFTKQQLAQKLCTNRTYLSRYFMAKGTTFNGYVNGLRIDHFIRLYQAEVEAGNQSPVIKTIAEQSGFQSYYTFYDVFKRTKGMNVTQWIKENY